MTTLTRSGQTSGTYVKLEPEIPIPPPSPSTEWGILQAFRSHHERLERKTKYQPLDRSLQRVGSIKWQNDIALFDTSLRQILTKGDLDTIVKHKLNDQAETAQSHLASICTLLNRLANSALLSEFFENANLEEKDSPYPKLLLLAQLLKNTKWGFDLTTGQGRVLFVLELEQDADDANNVVRAFDNFFSRAIQLPMRTEKVQQPTSELWESRHELRDQAVNGLESLFLHVPQAQSQECEGHRILVRLPDWKTIERRSEPNTALQLFFSTCASSGKWHQAWCDIQSTSANDDEDFFEFCEELRYANARGNVFQFIASDKKLLMPSNDDEERPVQPNYQPTRSLRDLIENQNFVEPRNINPLMPLIKAQRFHEKQRRALAARLALNLSLFLNSEYVLNAYDASTVFFIIENGRCELDLVYATLTANNHDKNTPFNESIYLYDNLARLLLEIEYGVSLKSLELEEVKSWVDDRLILDKEELGSDFCRDTVNIKDIEARTSYLTAVRDLLNFKKTYRKGSRRLRGRFFDVGAIAGEIIFSDVAERLRSSIEPTYLRALGLESSIEEPFPQCPDSVEIQKREERKFVMTSAMRTTTQKSRTTTPIQLFDDKDDFSEDKGKATGADFFFSQLNKFHESCEERADSIQSHLHKPVRIAVLDTGINQNNGAISGGLTMKHIQHQNCRSWVGDNPNNVHDCHGHGTRIVELILRAAPEADVYVCKVFNGTRLQPDEAKNIAKAIRYAVDVWDVDIISMSFGLTPPSPNDAQLQAAYKDIEVAIENAGSKVFFAAAANHGSHGPRTFPANHPSVICIHASDGKGKDGGISPEPESTDDNFMTLGIALNFGDERKSGTSYAAPLAASMAAHILYVAENLLDLSESARHRLRTGRGMREMFRLMCGPRCSGGYRFVAPWVRLWTQDWHLDGDKIKNIETTVLTTDLFKY